MNNRSVGKKLSLVFIFGLCLGWESSSIARPGSAPFIEPGYDDDTLLYNEGYKGGGNKLLYFNVGRQPIDIGKARTSNQRAVPTRPGVRR